jgi:hypothetical protein
MGIFEQPEEDSVASRIGAFRVTIGRTLAFELITSYVAAGSSFQQASNVLRETHQRTRLNKLSGVRESDVAKYIRAIVAVNLHKMSSLLQSKECLEFSIAFEGATKHGISFIDARLRMHVEGEIQNLHLLAVPLYERNTGTAVA